MGLFIFDWKYQDEIETYDPITDEYDYELVDRLVTIEVHLYNVDRNSMCMDIIDVSGDVSVDEIPDRELTKIEDYVYRTYSLEI